MGRAFNDLKPRCDLFLVNCARGSDRIAAMNKLAKKALKTPRVSVDQVGPGTHLIARRKLVGFGTHYGVLFRLPPYADQVVHKDTEGHHIVTVESFAQGHPVWIEQSAPPDKMHEMIAAAHIALAKNEAFNILTANCENFARGVVTGKSRSGQVEGGFALALFGLLIYVGAKSE